MGASLSNIQLDKEYLLQAENTEINLVALSSVFALPSITIDDVDGSASSAAISVVEASQDTVTGTFRVQSEAGLAAVMINGIDISQARSDNVITFLTGYGTLRITGFDPSTGVFQYDYTDNGLAKDHSYGNYSVIDQFVITVMDQVGQSVSNTLDVMILDTEGSGQDDFGVMTEDTSSISGNVLANDVLSADAPHSLTFWNEVNGVVVGKWGTLHVQSNGDWVYQLNKDLPQVQGLKDNQALNEEFRYLLVDADDDQILRSLFVKIEGVTDADPVIFIPDSSNTVGAVDLILTEGSGTQVQSYFTVQADAGIKKQTILDIEITDSENTTPLTIGTSKGMLVIYSYDMAKGKISFTYTEGMRAHNHNANDDNIFDQFMISLTDNEGKVTNKPLTVWIADTEPNANNDVANMTSDQSAISGNVIANDFAGADALAGVVFNGAIAGAQAGTKVVQGKYGLLIFSEATGEWTYELDQNNPALTQLPLGSVITENFIYGLKDADGDASYAALDISVKTVDTTAPSVILSMSDQALKLGETAVVTFSFSEMITGFDLRDVTVENGTLSNLQTADGGKTWTATFIATANVDDASNTISVKDGSYTDLAGNVGTGNFINYAIDNVAPNSGTTAIMVDNITADNVVNGKEAKENVLVTGKVSGEFQVGDVVTLVLNGNRYLTQVLNTAGDYSTFVKGSDLVADSDHTLDASVAAHDAAGNVGIVGTQKAYGIDVSVDPALLVLNNFYDSFNPYVAGTSSDMLSNDRNYDLSVIGLEVGGFAQYQLWNGFSWVNTTSAQINMADGPYQYRAVVTDAYGNDPYITQTITLEVDATAPAMPTGVALTDRVLSGTAEAGTTVIVSDGDRVIATTTAQANGQFSVTLSTMPSRAGLSVTSMDLAGNESVPAVPGYHYRVWTVASSWTNTEGPLAYRPNYCSYNVYEPYRTSSGNDWIEIVNGPQRNWCYPEQGSIWSYYCNTVTLIAMGAGNDRLDTGVSGGKGSMYSNTQVDMGTGDDVFNLKGDMYGNSQVAMGDGDDVFNVGQSIRDSSKVNLGNGNDVLRVGGYVEDCAVVNAGEGDNVVTVGGVIDNAKITFGSGNDQLTVTGEFNGCDATASMGAGDDILTFTGKKVVGQLEGGSGFDTLVLDYTADNSLVNSCVNVTNLSSANFTGFELIKMEGKNAVDIRYCDLAADTSRTGALFIQGGRDSKVDLGGNNWNSDSTWMRDLTDSSGWRMESWRKCGSTIMDDVAYDIYRHSAGGYNYINDVYIQQGIQVI